MEIKVHLPPWPKLRLIIFLLLPVLAVLVFWLYLVVSASIYSLVYPQEKPRSEIAATQPASTSAPAATNPAPAVGSPAAPSAGTSAASPAQPLAQPTTAITDGANAVPDNLSLARQALADGKLAEAYASFKLVVTANPDDITARTQLRVLALKLGQIDDLKKFYEERMAAKPKEDAYPLSLGTLYLTVDRNKEKAREMFELSLKLNPISAAAKYNLSIVDGY